MQSHQVIRYLAFYEYESMYLKRNEINIVLVYTLRSKYSFAFNNLQRMYVYIEFSCSIQVTTISMLSILNCYKMIIPLKIRQLFQQLATQKCKQIVVKYDILFTGKNQCLCFNFCLVLSFVFLHVMAICGVISSTKHKKETQIML